MIPIDPADDQDGRRPGTDPGRPAVSGPLPAQAMAHGGTFVRPGAFAWGRGAAAPSAPDASCEVIEQALAAAAKDADRVSELLDELSRARLWLPLPDVRPVTDGSAVVLPTVVYLGAEFVPAFTSARRLGRWGESARRHADARNAPPHIVVPAAALARRLPAGVGIALNPGAEASVPIYPEGVAYLAATEVTASGAHIRVGHPPAEPVALLREVRSGLHELPAVRQASRAWLSVPGEGEGLVISVSLDDPASEAAHEAVLGAVEGAAAAVAGQARFPVHVTFPGEAEPDQVDAWVAEHAPPFYIRG